jgi:putative DNA methylase
MSHPIKSPRKLIEVALPLDAINTEAALRKRKAPSGYPTTLHKWWAQRPPAAALAIIFSQLVNDPGYQQGGGFKYGMNKKDAAEERKRLFKIIEDLVLWENTNNETVLERARAEIRRSWREVCELNKDHPQAAHLFNLENPPAFYDPFGGSGAMPLEAQRLGLRATSSDLNPVAVLLNKAMIEIPPKFSGQPPVRRQVASETRKKGSKAKGQGELDVGRDWPRATGLAEDVRSYGAWMRAEAEKRIGHLYPPVAINAEMARERPDLKPLVGQKRTVIAWLWARTVKSPNPAFSHVDVPLASNFILSSKPGKESYVQPVVEGDTYSFTVRVGTPPTDAREGTKAPGRGANFRCLVSDVVVDGDYIKAEGQAGRMGTKLMAVVVEGVRGRAYLSPTAEMENAARSARPTWKPNGDVPARLTGGTCVPYGLKEWGDLFTSRQLVGLTTFSDLIGEARERIRQDALTGGLAEFGQGLEAGGTAAQAYADAVSVYLAFAVDRVIDYGCSLSTWRPKDNAMRSGLAKQAIPMSWDFAEGSPFGDSSSGFSECVNVVVKVLELALAPRVSTGGHSFQHNASEQIPNAEPLFISTDPPYYNNISYADLSDFYYIWLRRALKSTFPVLFSTIAVPKVEELVATPYRHGGVIAAEQFFLNGMTNAMSNLATLSHPSAPVTIYYAFKQAETESEGTASTGWETFLAAVLKSGFALTGTWPVRTEGDNRQVGVGNNALASSIVLVCRKRSPDAPTISRREFIRELNTVLPEALDEMTKGAGGEYSPVAPVDLSQAIIGPGMAVFSKYAAVLEADGSPMGVRTALQLINRFFGEDDFDADTQWCLRWFEQHGWSEGVFGEADVLARSKSISVGGLAESGVVVSGGGKVGLRKWADYPTDWDPRTDTRTPIWETLHQLIRALKQDGESSAGTLLAAVKAQGEAARQLAYRLYTLCERQGWAEDARAYNELITSWTGIESAAGQVPAGQGELFQ